MVNTQEGLRNPEAALASLDMEKETIVGRFQHLIDKVKAYVIPGQEK